MTVPLHSNLKMRAGEAVETSVATNTNKSLLSRPLQPDDQLSATRTDYLGFEWFNLLHKNLTFIPEKKYWCYIILRIATSDKKF